MIKFKAGDIITGTNSDRYRFTNNEAKLEVVGLIDSFEGDIEVKVLDHTEYESKIGNVYIVDSKHFKLWEEKPMEKLEQLEAKYKELGAEIEKLKQEREQDKTSRWKPEEDEKYWGITAIGSIDHNIWTDHEYDEQRYAFSNVFRTKEEAEFEVERLKVIAELKDYASEFKLDIYNYYIEYDMGDREIYIDCEFTYKRSSLCFTSELIARQAIEAVGEDRVKKYYLGVE